MSPDAPDRRRLDGRTALVTGAGQGVGRGIARAMAHAGADVAVLDIVAARAATVAAEITELGRRSVAITVDVSDTAQVRAAVDGALAALGRLDVVVNNAQTVVTGAVLDVSAPDAATVWSTGFLGAFNVMQAARPHLGRGSSVINVVSSVMLKSDTSGFAMYAATKSAIRSLTRTAAVEWGPDGVRVNALSPQTTSPAWEEWSAANPVLADHIRHEIPLGRLGDPESDVGPVAVWLASDASAYVTGGLLLADGGRGHLR